MEMRSFEKYLMPLELILYNIFKCLSANTHHNLQMCPSVWKTRCNNNLWSFRYDSSWWKPFGGFVQF